MSLSSGHAVTQVAAVQAGCVFFNRDACLDKAVMRVAQAAQQGVRLWPGEHQRNDGAPSVHARAAPTRS